jgi:hypothetical protein
MKSAHLSNCNRILPKEDGHVTCATWYLGTSIESGTWFSSDSVQPRNHTVTTRLADAQDRVSPELHATLVLLG